MKYQNVGFGLGNRTLDTYPYPLVSRSLKHCLSKSSSWPLYIARKRPEGGSVVLQFGLPSLLKTESVKCKI
jgi:hypothetical protein